MHPIHHLMRQSQSDPSTLRIVIVLSAAYLIVTVACLLWIKMSIDDDNR